MKNYQAHWHRYCWSLLLTVCCSWGSLQAQLDFTFNYSGPDSLIVGADCTIPFDWGAPSSISVTCNSPGCSITTFEVFNITGGYTAGDDVAAGDTILITYFAEDNQGNDAFFGFDIRVVDTLAPTFDSTSLPPPLLDLVCLTDLPAPPNVA
ncbi:MAG: hypothetical protein AAFR05_18025, partial [Bacteroidota bacterium]